MNYLGDREVISRIMDRWLEPPQEGEMERCECGHLWEDHKGEDESDPCRLHRCGCKNYESSDMSAFYEDLDYRSRCCPDK